jgi:hypothetical protein
MVWIKKFQVIRNKDLLIWRDVINTRKKKLIQTPEELDKPMFFNFDKKNTFLMLIFAVLAPEAGAWRVIKEINVYL